MRWTAKLGITSRPNGLGLHWPQLDADLYVPALIEGAFGSRRGIQHIGEVGGSARRIKRRHNSPRVDRQRSTRFRQLPPAALGQSNWITERNPQRCFWTTTERVVALQAAQRRPQPCPRSGSNCWCRRNQFSS